LPATPAPAGRTGAHAMSPALLQPPRFISLEGVEGAGKSTAISAIRDCLQAHGHEVVLTREPDV
ncbi:hypothetical protein SB773_33625, partial [Bacillus sp. SIMBA_074]|uniref:dTMP kinase n=1 Tax=Bacillus sp. SIMBA_074 TaxID=3085812 RepID=UPI00397C2EAC